MNEFRIALISDPTDEFPNNTPYSQMADTREKPGA